MNIIICGAGNVGIGLAEYLSLTGNNVTIIDENRELIEKTTDTLDCKGVAGVATHPDILEQADTENCDLIISVTKQDEANLLISHMAHSLFSVPTQIACVSSKQFLQSKWGNLYSSYNLAIDYVFSPEKLIAEHLANICEIPESYKVVPMLDGKVVLIGLKLEKDCPILGHELYKVSNSFPGLQAIICSINRNGQALIADKNTILEKYDKIYFLVNKEHLERALKAFGLKLQRSQKILIAGGGRISEELALQIESRYPNILLTIIETDKNRCAKLEEIVKNALIINGNAIEKNILEESQIHNIDQVFCLTNNDQTNILIALLTRQLKVPNALAIMNHPEITSVAPNLNFNGIINPRSVIVSEILRYVRKGKVQKVYSLFDGFAEIIEAKIQKNSALSNREISKLDLPKHIKIVFCLDENDKLFIPNSETILRVGMSIIIFCPRNLITEIEELLSISY